MRIDCITGITESSYTGVGEKYEITDNRKVDHDKEWIIGRIKKDGDIK